MKEDIVFNLNLTYKFIKDYGLHNAKCYSYKNFNFAFIEDKENGNRIIIGKKKKEKLKEKDMEFIIQEFISENYDIEYIEYDTHDEIYIQEIELLN